MSLTIAVANDSNGRIKVVLSRGGFVVFEAAQTVSRNPTKAIYANALRIIANKIECAPFKEDFGAAKIRKDGTATNR